MSAIDLQRWTGALGLLTWPLQHIRWKIVLPYAFLTVLLAAAGSYIATALVTGNLTERFNNQLAEAGRVAADNFVQEERQHLESLRSVAFTEGVADATRAGDQATLTRLIEPIAANRAVERLEILDAQGRRIDTLALTDAKSLTYEAINDADTPASWPLVQTVLAGRTDEFGDKQAQIVRTKEGFVFYTAGPISGNGQTVGVVMIGTPLESLAKEIKSQVLADVTFYDFSGHPLASTFGVSNSDAPLDVSGAVLDGSVQGNVIRENRTLFGRGYDLLYGRLQVRNRIVGLYSVGLSTNFIFSAGNTTRTRVVILFGIGMAAVLAVGFYLTHRLTTPILRLVRTARLVAAGDLTIRSGVKSRDEIGVLATSFDEMTDKLQRQHLATIRALTSAIDARDPYTMGHSLRVGQLSVMLGQELGLDDSVLARLEVGGYLHDIGKIGIRDAVLLKPGSLTPAERRAIQEHPQIGLAILEHVDLAEEVIEFVRGHHERLDGSGYPGGLKDAQIPVVARIAAVADIYDAITSERPYRGPMPPDDALQLLRSQAGQLLDPDVVRTMATVLKEWEQRRSLEPALRGFRLPDFAATKVRVRARNGR